MVSFLLGNPPQLLRPLCPGAGKGVPPPHPGLIRRNQEVLAQLERGEMGTKGAASDHLYLPARQVFSPHARSDGGGDFAQDRRGEGTAEIKEIVHDLEVPEGMA